MTDDRIEVALPLPLFGTFTYRLPPDTGGVPVAGTRVVVPFGRRRLVGWVSGPGQGGDELKRIRSVVAVLDAEPLVSTELLELARWMARYYVAPLGLVLRSMLPAALSVPGREVVRITAPGWRLATPGPLGVPPQEMAELPAAARHVLQALHGALTEAQADETSGTGTPTRGASTGPDDSQGPDAPTDQALPLSRLDALLRERAARPGLLELERRGLARVETLPPPEPPVRTRRVVGLVKWLEDLARQDELFGRAPRQRECFELLAASGGRRELAVLTGSDGFSRSVITGLEEKGLVELTDEEMLRDPFEGDPDAEMDGGTPVRHPPTPAQAHAIEALTRGLDDPDRRPFLLHGVTGSGKTLVYIELLRTVVEERGRSAIVLVPEIALTPQTVQRFRAQFGDRVAVLHSALSDGERYDAWRQLRDGSRQIVVGARSALFAPLSDLGAIVVDEEHDGSYKQSETPRYHARDLAVLRARQSGAVCVLGSATPSLESWRNVEEDKFERLALPERVGGRPLPPVEVVDLRVLRKAGDHGILSPVLGEALQARLDRREQSILLLNRRGWSSFVKCRACGHVMECPHCSVSLTYHRTLARVRCHHCRHEEEAPDRCPECSSPDLQYRGLGTEQVERVVSEHFPEARIARMDVDTTGGKWSHAEILGRVRRGEVDILLGTQMIAKGLDFPRVTLVGVVNADTGLHLPDFRASERTFQLLSQVAGRAGRGVLGGEVIIQSTLPEHYAIQCALTHDFEGFARRELDEREALRYPPHLRLVNVVTSSPDVEEAAAAAEGAVAWLEPRLRSVEGPPRLVGPAPCPLERLHGRWRWHFFIRGGTVGALTGVLHQFMSEFRPPGADVRVSLDRDPVALL